MCKERPMTTFPDGFLWGTATAGHQVEGGNVSSDMWAAEWAEGAAFAEPSGDACDHYHRYPDDLATMADLGFNAYRFSVEWSRVEPEEGFFSRAALDHYRRMAGACHERGLTPVVTYNHFTSPTWFAMSGGWGSSTAPDRFGRYCEQVTSHLGDLVPWACTLNEPNVIELLIQTGTAPAGAEEDSVKMAALAEAFSENAAPTLVPSAWGGHGVETMAAAHRRAVEAIKSVRNEVQVGWTLALIDLQPIDGGDEHCEKVRKAGELDWLDIARDDDFIGVQTYSRNRLGPNGKVEPDPGVATMQTGWEVYPEALEHTVRLAAERTSRPVMVTENGMATDDDDARINYTRRALEGLAGCLDDGIDVRGYLHWTLLDNFEWVSGFGPKFGVIAVDRTTFERTIKPSARWLGGVARVNKIS
jgi:beta-glucosidase